MRRFGRGRALGKISSGGGSTDAQRFISGKPGIDYVTGSVASVGKQLIATVGTIYAPGGVPSTSTWTTYWYADGVFVTSAEKLTFTPGVAQFGKVITVRVSFTQLNGVPGGQSLDSDPTAAVIDEIAPISATWGSIVAGSNPDTEADFTFTAGSDNVAVSRYDLVDWETFNLDPHTGSTNISPPGGTVSGLTENSIYLWRIKTTDSSGNVSYSGVSGIRTQVTPDPVTPDVVDPTVDTFTATSTENTLVIPITAFTASDTDSGAGDANVIAWMIKDVDSTADTPPGTVPATRPASTDPGWTSLTTPTTSMSVTTTYTLSDWDSARNLYPFVKDAAGNVNTLANATAKVATVTADDNKLDDPGLISANKLNDTTIRITTVAQPSDVSGIASRALYHADDVAGSPGSYSELVADFSSGTYDHTVSANTIHWYKVLVTDNNSNAGYTPEDSADVTPEPPATDFTDTFADLTGWTGLPTDPGSWSVSGNTLIEASTGNNVRLRYDTAVGDTNQIMKMKVNQVGGKTVGFMLRNNNDNGLAYSVTYYQLQGAGTERWSWEILNGSTYESDAGINSVTVGTPLSDTNYIGVAIEGTGANTTVSCWKWSSDPDSGGVINVANWGTPVIMQHNGTSRYADVGQYMGISVWAEGSGTPAIFSDWRGKNYGGGAVATAPQIIVQPQNKTAVEGGTATFTVTATGTATLAYQWQVSTNGGTSYSNVGTDSNSYTTGTLTSADSGNLYRVTVSNDISPDATSTAATLTVSAAGAFGRVAYEPGDGTNFVSKANPGDWSTAERNGPSIVSTAIDGGSPYSGFSAMMQLNWDGTVAWNDPASYTTPGSLSFAYNKEFLLRWYARADADAENGLASNVFGPKVARIGDDGCSFMDINPRSSGGAIQVSLCTNTDGAGVYMMGPNEGTAYGLNCNQWRKLELYVYEDATNGVIRMWIDDSLHYEVSGINTQKPGSWSPLTLGSNWSCGGTDCDHDATNHIYWNGIEIYSDAGTDGATGTLAGGDASV